MVTYNKHILKIPDNTQLLKTHKICDNKMHKIWELNKKCL